MAGLTHAIPHGVLYFDSFARPMNEVGVDEVLFGGFGGRGVFGVRFHGRVGHRLHHTHGSRDVRLGGAWTTGKAS